MDEKNQPPKGSRRRAELARLSVEDFKQMIRVTCGPAPKTQRPGLIKPGDRGYSKVGPPRNSDGGAQ